jgi:conjugative transfer signal peptidase TraF
VNRRAYGLATLFVAALFAFVFVAVALCAPRPVFTWNASASAPIGLYHLTVVSQPPVGALVAITPPVQLARFLAQRRYLPIGVPLLKHVAARSGEQVCRFGSRVTINGAVAAVALGWDRSGRALPVWRGCHVVGRNELFLLNAAADSMDGRYFGAIPVAGLIGRATPILTRSAPDAPLRWRGLDLASAYPASRKGQSPCR